MWCSRPLSPLYNPIYVWYTHSVDEVDTVVDRDQSVCGVVVPGLPSITLYMYSPLYNPIYVSYTHRVDEVDTVVDRDQSVCGVVVPGLPSITLYMYGVFSPLYNPIYYIVLTVLMK